MKNQVMKTQIASIAFALATAFTASNASALSIEVNPYYSDIELTSNYQDSSCDLWGQVSSKRSYETLTFNFINHTGTYKIVSWLDHKGNAKEYATLRPGQSVEVETYEGHPWMIQDGRGDCLEVIKNNGKMAYKAPKPQVYPGTMDDYVDTYKVSGTKRYGGYLNMRKGPSMQYGKIAKLPEGYSVEILKTSNGWAKIQLSSGHTGWVNVKFLKAA